MSKKMTGSALSYLLIVVDIIVGIFFVPFLLQQLGDSEYGLYKLMFSTASYLSVLDFGIGATITRYVVKFKTEKKKQDEENFVAMGLLVYGALALIVLVAAVCINFAIPKLYAASIPAEKMNYARLMFIFLCANTAIHLITHAYTGLFHAYERFVYSKMINITKILFRVLLIIVGVLFIKSAIVIVVVDISLSLLVLLCNILYAKYSLKCRIKLYKWDKVLAKEAFVFTFAILGQSIINQFNTNVDNLVLGIYTTTATVALYSIALQLFTMYSSLSTAISSVYLPSISRSVFKGESDDEVTERIIEPSRIQLTILLLALTGFFLFGKAFISVWVGAEYLEVYLLCCILLTTATVELSQNTITAILKAKNMLHGKTLILAGSTVVNVVLTFILVPRMGTLGAAIGTAFSMVFGYGLALNLYYHFKIHVNMITYYKKTYHGILPAAIIACLIGIPISLFINLGGWGGFVVKALIYVAVYAVVIYFLGFNKQEKQLLKNLFKKLSRKKAL